MSKAITGEYYLQGMHEMASGFLLRADGSFQFFFSYGALDRFGSGKWMQQDGRVILNSAPKPASDFILISSSATGDDHITIRMKEANPVLLNHVFCSLKNGGEGSWQQMNREGELVLPQQPFTHISLLLEFCAERFSQVPIPDPGHNEFVFAFKESIMEVFFENFTLQNNEEGLYGGHPLMNGRKFAYVKN